MTKTLYEILGISPGANHSEIESSFLRLTQHYTTQATGKDPADADIQIKILKEAYSVLSDNGRRAGYDASLAARATPTRIEVEIREPRRSAQKTLLLVIGSLIAIGMVIQLVLVGVSYNRASKMQAAAEKFNEQKRLEVEDISTELRAPKAASEPEPISPAADARRLAEEARQRTRELEDSRRYAERISAERIRAEEQAQRQADAEKKRVEQEELRRKQQQEQDAQRQISDSKRRLQELESLNRR